MSINIYLAGPITGCDDSEANDWRREFKARLETIGIHGISPLRCEPLHGDRYGNLYPDPRFGTAKAISSKNVEDVRRCDLTLAFFPYAETDRKVSIGTLLEIGEAHGRDKPIIVVSKHPLMNHGVLEAFASWKLTTLDEAFEVIEGLYSDYAARIKSHD